LLVITVLAAILTPSPDALSMVLFMLVLIALYFVGVGVSWAVVRNKKKRDLAAEAR